MKTKNQMINFFEARLNELQLKMDGSSSPYEVDNFPIWNKAQRKQVVDL